MMLRTLKLEVTADTGRHKRHRHQWYIPGNQGHWGQSTPTDQVVDSYILSFVPRGRDRSRGVLGDEEDKNIE